MITKTKPYQHQIIGYNVAMEHLAARKASALFMEMGTGKSKLAIDLVSNMPDVNAVLLVAPNGIHTQWYDEQVPTHSPVPTWRHVWNNSKSAKAEKEYNEFCTTKSDKLKWLFVNVDRFSTWNDAIGKKLFQFMTNNRWAVILDEATRIKNSTANRTRTLIKLGAMAAYRVILTGTPVTNSPFDVYSMVEFLIPGYWQCNFFTFKHRYGLLIKDNAQGRTFHREMTEKDFGMVRYYIRNGRSVEETSLKCGIAESSVRYLIEHPAIMRPYKNIEELKQKIAPIAYMVKKSDCLDLPPKIYQTVRVEMSEDQERVYKDLKKNLLSEYAGQELTVANKMTLSLRLQQVTGGYFPYVEEDGTKKIVPIGGKNPKIEALIAEIDEAGDTTKIIVWARFVAEIVAILHELKKEFPDKGIEAYYGAVPDARRNEIKQEFQAGLIDVLIINPQTGSMGLNLQRSTLHYFYSNTFSLEHRMQAEDRSHRIGQTESVVYKDLIVAGTIDDHILAALRDNREVAEYFSNKEMKDLL